MSSPKFTPGPWKVTPADNDFEMGVDAVIGGWGIATCAHEPGDGTALDNARLIAAAPELYEAALALVDVLTRCDADTRPNDLSECTDDEWDVALAKGRAALAKVQS